MTFHNKSVEESLKLLSSDENGLSAEEAKKRLLHHGKNLLPEGKKKGFAEIFFEQFKSPIIYVLLIAAAVSFAIREFTDAFFILAVLLINAIIGSYQEFTAGQKADLLKKIVKTYAYVLRDGEKKKIPSHDLTIGDIVFLESGSKIPADLRLIASKELYVNESLLTGESTDILKEGFFLSNDEKLPVADRKNMLYAGAHVSKGRGKAVVTEIAENTEVGKIASLLAKSTETKPPLIMRMEIFSMKIAKIIGIIVVLLALLGIYHDMPIKDIFFLSVALAVSSIPEGLPVAITVALSVASNSMSKRNVIVRKLSAIEGLGSCTMIASDKTGTLTQNSLTVKHFIAQEQTYSEKEWVDEKVYLASILCNESNVVHRKGEYDLMGDQVDVAIARYAIESDEKYMQLMQDSQKVDEIPYEPINSFSASSVKMGGEIYQFVKGSPEKILRYCDIDLEGRERVLSQVDEWASKGYRNIALAYKKSDKEKITLKEFEYLGFVAIIDPLREGVKEAVEEANIAGIQVAMITGDHPNTAFSIAKELGIATEKEEVMGGEELQKWSETGADKNVIAHKRVFARVSPEQKQKIVTTFQELGYFIAVTGDGVNDAPALKYANIGISMGKSGTDVARESSNLILTDDSFKSIVNGIEEGRVAYDNIRKVIHLLISTGFAEIILVVLSMLFFMPIPLLPVQLLWLNLVTNGIQDVALGMEKAEPGVLKRKPREPKEPIFNSVMISRVVAGGIYMGIGAFIVFWAVLELGYSEESARNITLLLMVLFENVHVFNSRSETHSIFKINHLQNLFLVFSVIIAQIVHIGCMYVPFMQSLLELEPVSVEMWLLLLAIALVLVAVMEAEKKFRRKSG